MLLLHRLQTKPTNYHSKFERLKPMSIMMFRSQAISLMSLNHRAPLQPYPDNIPSANNQDTNQHSARVENRDTTKGTTLRVTRWRASTRMFQILRRQSHFALVCPNKTLFHKTLSKSSRRKEKKIHVKQKLSLMVSKVHFFLPLWSTKNQHLLQKMNVVVHSSFHYKGNVLRKFMYSHYRRQEHQECSPC